MAGLSVTNGYDQYLRRTNLVALNSTTPILHHSYGYDPSSRLQTVTDKTTTTNYSATYTYIANSPLVSQIDFKENTTVRMTTTKQFDNLNRLTSISSVPSASSVVSFDYQYNNANQRTRCRLADGSFWIYKYDSLGQVVSGKKYWSDFTPVAGQQFEYSFDDIGNRTTTQAGGDETGANLRSSGYNANDLNQYTVRIVPGAFDVIGAAFATNSVTVNSADTYRHGEYFRKEITVDNGLVPVWQPVTVASPGQSSVTGNEFVPKYLEFFHYDLDGNLTNDGRWTYYWDAENRLVKMAANTSVGPQISLQFEYDSKSRRIRKQVWNNTGWTGSSTNDLQFIYDGWNLIAELSNSHSALRTYTWGLDLSGSLQGAGGVGGLIGINDSASGFHFATFDGNGNVSGMMKAIDGSASAHYDYGPFGEVIRTTGSTAKANPIRFSTQYYDDESDFVVYPHRLSRPSTGRFLSRDPYWEQGFKKNAFKRQLTAQLVGGLPNAGIFDGQESLQYVFVGNDPANSIDLLGLCDSKRCGRAVDNALRLTHTDVVTRFDHLGLWGKARACGPIWFPTPGYSMAWDMYEMTWNWNANMPCGQQTTCDQTVTVGGKCYNAWDVNYMLYGWASSMCGMTLSQMYDHVILWKLLKRDFSRLPGALAFSTLGWVGTYSPLPPEFPFGYPACSACSLNYQKDLGSVWP